MHSCQGVCSCVLALAEAAPAKASPAQGLKGCKSSSRISHDGTGDTQRYPETQRPSTPHAHSVVDHVRFLEGVQGA